MKKKTWEKLHDRMEKAREQADAVCREMDFDCEHCPLYVEDKSKDCAKWDIRHAQEVLAGYESRRNVKESLMRRGPWKV